MKRLLILPAVAVLCVAEMYRRGFAAPVLYGCRCWVSALDPRPLPTTEPDYLA